MYSVRSIYLSSNGSSLLKRLMSCRFDTVSVRHRMPRTQKTMRSPSRHLTRNWNSDANLSNSEFQILSGRGFSGVIAFICVWGCWPTNRRWLWISCRFVQKCSSHTWLEDGWLFLVNARVIVVSRGIGTIESSLRSDRLWVGELGRWRSLCQEVQQDSNKRFYFSPKDLWWRIDGGQNPTDLCGIDAVGLVPKTSLNEISS